MGFKCCVLPSGKELLHPVATYGHKAGEAVVAFFFTLAATWYCVSERDSVINLLTALAPESKHDTARETLNGLATPFAPRARQLARQFHGAYPTFSERATG
jgi:hypothetical protein